MKSRYNITNLIRKRPVEAVYEAVDSLDHRVVMMRRFCSEHFYIWDASVKIEFDELLKEFAEMRHSNLVYLIDGGIDEDGPFVTSPLIDGTLLGDLIRERNRLSQEEVRQMAINILGALNVVHEQNQFHGVWSLDSVVVSQDEGELTDFYLADIGISRVGEILFKERWSIFDFAEVSVIAPEIYAKQSPSVKTDLYSLGHILYLSLIGGHPYAELSIAEKAEAHQLGDIPKLSEYIAIDKELEAWIHQLMHTSPDRRPPSASHALDELLKIKLKRLPDTNSATRSLSSLAVPERNVELTEKDQENLLQLSEKTTNGVKQANPLDTLKGGGEIEAQINQLRSRPLKSMSGQLILLVVAAVLCIGSTIAVYLVKGGFGEEKEGEVPIEEVTKKQKTLEINSPTKTQTKKSIDRMDEVFTVSLGNADFAGQVFSDLEFREIISIGDRESKYTYQSDSPMSLGFEAAGVSDKNGGNFTIGSTVLSMSQLDKNSAKSTLEFDSNATGYVHFNSVSLLAGKSNFLELDLKDLKGSSNDNDDDVVIRLRINNTYEQVLVDTRGHEVGKVGKRKVKYAFADSDKEVELLIDFSSADKRDGYAIGGIRFFSTTESVVHRPISQQVIDTFIFAGSELKGKSLKSESGQRVKLKNEIELEADKLLFSEGQYAELSSKLIKEVSRSNFSIECNFVLKEKDRESGLVSFAEKNGTAYERGFLLSIENNRLCFNIGRGGRSGFAKVIAYEVLKTGVTYRAVGTYNGDMLCLYLNGKLVDTFHFPGRVAYPKKYPPLVIGAFVDDNQTMPFTGFIDSATLYSSELSAIEVAELATQ